jgi:hypothetical protein
MNMKSKKEKKIRSIPIQQDPMVVQYLAADISTPPPPLPDMSALLKISGWLECHLQQHRPRTEVSLNFL